MMNILMQSVDTTHHFLTLRMNYTTALGLPGGVGLSGSDSGVSEDASRGLVHHYGTKGNFRVAGREGTRLAGHNYLILMTVLPSY